MEAQQGEERVWVGIGSNEGDRNENVVLALLLLSREAAIRIHGCSRAWLSEPVSEVPQPVYLNAVVEVGTALEPADFFERLRRIENRLGRRREVRWGPRTIDLDVLLFGSRIVETPDLRIPHPRMHERHFVLYPLSDLAPGVRHPVSGLSVAEVTRRLPPLEVPPKPVAWGRIPRWSTVSTATSSSRA